MDLKKIKKIKISKKKKEKRKKKSRGKDAENAENFRIITKFKPLMFLDFVAGNELVVVERPWVKISEKFPEALYRHKYST